MFFLAYFWPRDKIWKVSCSGVGNQMFFCLSIASKTTLFWWGINQPVGVQRDASEALL